MSEITGGFTRVVEIFAASCSGCIGLSRAVELPVACVRATADADATLEAMSRESYGAGSLWLDSFQPFETQPGWRDWHLLPWGPDGGGSDTLRFDRGRLVLQLPDYVATAGFEAALHVELGRLRLDAVTTSPTWLTARSDALKPLFVPPRYTLADANDFRAGATRVDDLFAIDAGQHLPLIVRLSKRALTRAMTLAREARRDDY